MKRQLIAAALALLCLGTPGITQAGPQEDFLLAAVTIYINGKLTVADCPGIVHTERVRAEQFLIATCDNKERYYIYEFNGRPVATSCTWLTETEGVADSPCHKERKIPTTIRDEPPLPKPAKPAPGAAENDHDRDIGIAMTWMFTTGRVTAAQCPNIVHTERVGPERILVATCDNKEAYVIVYSGDVGAAVSCTWLIAQKREAELYPCQNRRRLPNIIRGARY